MSDPKPAEPDDDLLEFLGGIDEVNDESQDDDFSEFLAKTDIDKPQGEGKNEGKNEDKKDGKSE